MSSKYLLDTNIISEVIRPRPNIDVIRQLTEYQFEVATASVVMHELLAGALRLPESKKQKFLLEYINSIPSKMPILSYDLQAAQ